MTQQTIVCTPVNSLSGDTLPIAFTKVNANFTELYAGGPLGPTVTALTTGSLSSQLPGATNALPVPTVLDNFTRTTIPATGSPVTGSLPDTYGANAWTQSGPGSALYEARVQANGTVRAYRRADNVVMAPLPSGQDLYLQQVASGTPMEMGCSFEWPTFAGNTGNPTLTLAISSDALPPNSNMFHINFEAGATGGGNNGSFVFAVWDSARGYVGAVLTPSVITTGTGFSGGTSNMPMTAGRTYRVRVVLLAPWAYVSVDGVGSGWAYYDRMANITGANLYMQIGSGVTIAPHSFWSRPQFSQSNGTYATFPSGLDNTPIGEKYPAPARFSGFYVDPTGAQVPLGNFTNISALGSQQSDMPTFQAPTGTVGGVRFACDLNFNFNLSFAANGVTYIGGLYPRINASVNDGGVTIRNGDVSGNGTVSIGVIDGAFAANGYPAYTTSNRFGLGGPTSPGIEIGAGVPAVTRPNGSLWSRTDAGGAGTRLYQRIGGAWIGIA